MAAFEEIKKSGAETGPIDQVIAEIEAESQKILQDPKARKELEDKLIKAGKFKEGEPIPDELVLKDARAIVIQSAKERVHEQIVEGAKQAQAEAIKIIEDVDASDEEMKVAQKGTLGQELFTMIDNAKKKIMSAVQ